MSIPAKLLLASIALNLFALSIDRPNCTSRPVRAEASIEINVPSHQRCCGAASA